MKVTFCDNCEKELMKEEKTVSFYFPTIFTITEQPGNSPYSHSIQSSHQERKNYTKHFCSQSCIGEYHAAYNLAAEPTTATYKTFNNIQGGSAKTTATEFAVTERNNMDFKVRG